MGETGIGKTALVKLLSSIMLMKFDTLNVHAGITSNEIIAFVNKYIESQEDIVLFFDEINTNEHVGGLLKEIVIDRRIDGYRLPKNIIPIAACNPYKLKKGNINNYT